MHLVTFNSRDFVYLWVSILKLSNHSMQQGLLPLLLIAWALRTHWLIRGVRILVYRSNSAQTSAQVATCGLGGFSPLTSHPTFITHQLVMRVSLSILATSGGLLKAWWLDKRRWSLNRKQLYTHYHVFDYSESILAYNGFSSLWEHACIIVYLLEWNTACLQYRNVLRISIKKYTFIELTLGA